MVTNVFAQEKKRTPFKIFLKSRYAPMIRVRISHPGKKVNRFNKKLQMLLAQNLNAY